MECSKCGYTLAPLEKECSRCRQIAHEAFLRSPAAVWPPAIGPAPVAEPPVASFVVPNVYATPPAHPEDNSEQNSSGEERGCPLEIAELHWNWGAFWCGWLWCFLNGLPGLAVLVIMAWAVFLFFTVAILPAGYALPSELMAVVIFGLHCHLGLRGHQLAWERRRFYGGLTQYFAVQRAWLIGGLISFGLAATLITVSTVAFLKAFRAYEARRQYVAPRAAPAAPRGPAPMVLRAAPPAVSEPPIYGQPIYGQHSLPQSPYRWTPAGPMRPQYRPGSGPGDVPVSPIGQPMPPASEGSGPASVPSSVPDPGAGSSPNTVPGPGSYPAPAASAPSPSGEPSAPPNMAAPDPNGSAAPSPSSAPVSPP